MFGRKKKEQEQLARRTWLRLSTEARTSFKTDAHRQEWRDLVAAVGPDSAVEQVEVTTAMGMADAAHAVMLRAMNDWDAGAIQADDAIAAINDIASEFGPRLEDQATVQVMAATSEDFPTVGSCAIFYVESMAKAATATIDGTLTDDVAEEWQAQLMTYEYACSKWDRESGRPRLPLVGDR